MGIGLSHSCKKYLYILRGIACAIYLEKEKKLPPLPYKEVVQYLPKNINQFFERCVIQKNTTEKAEIISNGNVTKFIESHVNQKFNQININFNKKDELNKYLIKTIKNFKY